jgi:hypothetical protein
MDWGPLYSFISLFTVHHIKGQQGPICDTPLLVVMNENEELGLN